MTRSWRLSFGRQIAAPATRRSQQAKADGWSERNRHTGRARSGAPGPGGDEGAPRPGLRPPRDTEIADLAARDFASASALLGDKPYIFGAAPCSADATLFGFTASAATPFFHSEVREAAEQHPNLIAFQWRMMDRDYEPAMAG
jgi:glutathione S-transferase